MNVIIEIKGVHPIFSLYITSGEKGHYVPLYLF